MKDHLMRTNAVARSGNVAPPIVHHRRQPKPWFFWICALVVIIAELLVTFAPFPFGLSLYAALMPALLLAGFLHHTVIQRRLTLALFLVPLMRVITLLLPLFNFPLLAQYPIVAATLLVTIGLFMRSFSLAGRQLGLRWGSPLQHFILICGGVAVGIVQYIVLRPTPLVTNLSLATIWLPVLILIVSTGLGQELVFRGVLQHVAEPVLKRWAIPYVALLFTVLHISFLSVEYLLVVFVTAMVFGLLVARSGTIVGTSLSFGCANVMIFLILPNLEWVGRAEFDMIMFQLVWAALLVSALAFALALRLSVTSIPHPLPSPYAVGHVPTALPHQSASATRSVPDGSSASLRTLRLGRGLTYVDLAQRTGISVRMLAEIEHGVRSPSLVEISSIRKALEADGRGMRDD